MGPRRVPRKPNPSPNDTMNTAMQALYWEVCRKNWLIFVAAGALLAGAAVAAWAVGRAASPEAEWVSTARALTGVAFFTSVVLCLGSFGPGESAGGGRIRSTTDRLFVLPVSTAGLVLLPLLAGAGFLTLLVLVWRPILDRIVPGLDMPYLIAVLVAGTAVTQALGWLLPKRPAQQVGAFAVLGSALFLLAMVPQDHSDQDGLRRALMLPLGGVTLAAAGFGWFAAHRNRCGDWPGGLSLGRLWRCVHMGRAAAGGARRGFRSLAGALFWSECRPPLRLLILSWVSLAVAICFLAWFSLPARQARYWTPTKLIAHVSMDVLPMLGVLCMAFWSLVGSSEPSTAFRTRLSSFRATLPLGSGEFAALRIGTVALGWVLVWVPLLMLSFVLPGWSGLDPRQFAGQSHGLLILLMAIGAQVALGPLPAILTGRFEGFNNLFLAGLCAWAWPWLTLRAAHADTGPEWDLGLLTVLLALKLVLAGVGFGLAIRRRRATWRFVAGVGSVWALAGASLGWGAWVWHGGELGWVAVCLFLVPLARLAACPFAVAANRCR